MVRTSRDVTEAELNVLRTLWNRAPLTIRQIAEALSTDDADGYYATVKKLLERLVAKGFVRREAAGIAFTYEASIDRDELVGRRLQEVSDSLCDGTLTPLLTQLAHHQKLNKKQQQTLMDLIDDLAKKETREAKSLGGER